jgi:hypothetical protein
MSDILKYILYAGKGLCFYARRVVKNVNTIIGEVSGMADTSKKKCFY